MARLDFRYADILLGVETSDPGDLDWLVEFLAPTFEALDGPVADGALAARLQIVVDAARHAELCATAPADVDAEPLLTLDTETVSLPAWSADGTRLWADARHGCVLRASAERLTPARLTPARLTPARLTLVASPDMPGRRLLAMRVLRELAAQAHRRRPGRLPLHAAALEVDGEGWLLAGPKHAGKTTLLVQLLLGHRDGLPPARLISNDRVFAELDDDGVAVRGMPNAVSIRTGTLERFPLLLRDVPEVRSATQLTLAELAERAATHPPHTAGRRLRVSPAAFCDRLGVGAVAAAPLGAVLLARVDPGVSPWRLDRLEAAAAAEALWHCRYGAGAGEARTALDRRLPGRAVDDLRASCDALARRVPVFTCRLGPDAYDAPDAARELLRDARQTAP